jgi:hypothetical protein
MPRLVRVRPCDGECCAESPRFPNVDKSDCIYHDDKGCQLQRDLKLIPEGSEDLVISTCLQWPHFWPAGRGTAGCCWQWVGNGN